MSVSSAVLVEKTDISSYRLIFIHVKPALPHCQRLTIAMANDTLRFRRSKKLNVRQQPKPFLGRNPMVRLVKYICIIEGEKDACIHYAMLVL